VTKAKKGGFVITMRLDGTHSRDVHESMNFMASMFQASTEYAIIGRDLNGAVQLWNEGARRLYGYEPEEVFEQGSSTVLDIPDHGPPREPAEVFQIALAEGKWDGTLSQRRKNGQCFIAHVVITPRRDAHGDAIGFLVMSRDISSEIRHSEELKTLQHYTRLLIESNADAAITIDPGGLITDANQQMEKLTGCSRMELVGSPFKLHFTDAERAEEGFRKVLSEGRVSNYDLTARARDGQETVVTYNATIFNDQNGQLQGVFAAAHDVTEYKRAASYCHGLLESAADAMVIVNPCGQIRLVNSQTETMFGYPRTELLDQFVELLVPRLNQVNYAAQSLSCHQDSGNHPVNVSQDLFGVRKDGTEFPVEITLNPLETQEGILVIRDITERKRAEHAITERNTVLERANRTKDCFLASMSHELRTPLNAVIGFTGTLLMRLPGPLNDEQEDQLLTVERSANQLLSLINDLLDLARIESGNVELNPAQVDCCSVVDEVIGTLRPMADSMQLELVTLVSDPEVQLRTDRRSLTQILLNLTTNALKFTEHGGVQIGFSQRIDNGTVTEIFVTDTGIGIAPEDQAQLFNAFHQIRGKRRIAHQGTGLGLYISQKLATLLGGRISVSSEPGKGSTFTLTIRET
jgi:PAS domain S-box-containing protein